MIRQTAGRKSPQKALTTSTLHVHDNVNHCWKKKWKIDDDDNDGGDDDDDDDNDDDDDLS